MVVLSLIYLCLGTVGEYARGPAVVLRTSGLDLTARTPGTVSSVEVLPGERVVKGQVLARFHAEPEAAESSARNEISSWRWWFPAGPLGHRYSRQSRLLARPARAGREASVGPPDPRAHGRGGQRHPHPPGPVSEFRGGHPRPHRAAAAFHPGGRPARGIPPAHAPGNGPAPRIDGYRFDYQDLVVDPIGDEVVGPSEIRRHLPSEIGETIQVQGPTVLVRGRLIKPTFDSRGARHRYHHGLQGSAEVRVRSQRIIFLLIPALRGAKHDGSNPRRWSSAFPPCPG